MHSEGVPQDQGKCDAYHFLDDWDRHMLHESSDTDDDFFISDVQRSTALYRAGAKREFPEIREHIQFCPGILLHFPLSDLLLDCVAVFDAQEKGQK